VSQPGGLQYPYVRVAGQIRERIDNGELRPGEQVPSVHQLSETYGVSRSTARRALDLLKEWGLTEALPGLGQAEVQLRAGGSMAPNVLINGGSTAGPWALGAFPAAAAGNLTVVDIIGYNLPAAAHSQERANGREKE